MEKKELEDLLENDYVNLNYTKLDGETREMEVTKRLDLIPEYHQPKGVRPYTGDLVNVYDLLADHGLGGWRTIDPEKVEIISAYQEAYEL